jgi:hypothetical protein
MPSVRGVAVETFDFSENRPRIGEPKCIQKAEKIVYRAAGLTVTLDAFALANSFSARQIAKPLIEPRSVSGNSWTGNPEVTVENSDFANRELPERGRTQRRIVSDSHLL